MTWALTPFSKPLKMKYLSYKYLPTESGELVANGNQIWDISVEDYLQLVAQMFLHMRTEDPG